MENTAASRRKGWWKSVLLALYIKPAVLDLESDGFQWVEGWQNSFEAVQGRTLVAPLLSLLLLNRHPEKVWTIFSRLFRTTLWGGKHALLWITKAWNMQLRRSWEVLRRVSVYLKAAIYWLSDKLGNWKSSRSWSLLRLIVWKVVQLWCVGDVLVLFSCPDSGIRLVWTVLGIEILSGLFAGYCVGR